jgi:hypothetical protein
MLLNEFEPEKVVVVERADGQSVFTRLQPETLTEWLNDHSLGELWQKNVLGMHTRRRRISMTENRLPHPSKF